MKIVNFYINSHFSVESIPSHRWDDYKWM